MVPVFLGFGGREDISGLGTVLGVQGTSLCMDMECHRVSGLPPDRVDLCSLAVERDLLGRSFFYRLQEKLYHDLH